MYTLVPGEQTRRVVKRFDRGGHPHGRARKRKMKAVFASGLRETHSRGPTRETHARCYTYLTRVAFVL